MVMYYMVKYSEIMHMMSLLHDSGNRWWWCRGQVSLAWCGNWKYDLCRRPSFSPTRQAGLKNRRWWRGHKLLLQANIFLSWYIALSAKNSILSHLLEPWRIWLFLLCSFQSNIEEGSGGVYLDLSPTQLHNGTLWLFSTWGNYGPRDWIISKYWFDKLCYFNYVWIK